MLTRKKRLLVGTRLLVLLVSLPAAAQTADPSPADLVGRILAPEGARVLVRREPCQCSSDGTDVILLTIGTESDRGDTVHFHPLATLAFDPTLSDEEPGQWMALWTFGPSAPGWRRTLRSLLPLPVGAPRASDGKLEHLDKRLAAIRQTPDQASLQAPDPVLHLASLGRSSRSQGIWGGLRRGLAWADVVNPAQFLFRTHTSQRKDRRERNFQRAYLALTWLLDVEYTAEHQPAWLASINDMRFHLLRNRSFFGRWVQHADALELVYTYESKIRIQLGKTSSWLQSAANEHYLRYQPVFRYTENGAAFPMGGVLYYDPRLGVVPDPDWWGVANPFDLPYNPHRHPEVQRLAREHPDELIPLAVYSFQTRLALRPIIAIDFFAPGNPQGREKSQQLMVLLKNWLAITTGSLSVERIPYRAIAWAANKKGYTLLVDKSSRLGVEELRLALESGLYFDPALRGLLLERADQRVLNPLVKAGTVEERLAHIQYESLRARDGLALCRTVDQVRQKMNDRLKVPSHLTPDARRQELARRLVAWHQQVRLEDFVSQPLNDFGSLGALEAPLRFFLHNQATDNRELGEVLSDLYAKLYAQQLRLPDGRQGPELEATLALTRQVWERALPGARRADFPQRVAKLEKKVRARLQEERREEEKQRLQALRELLKNSHEQLKQARRAGCRAPIDAPAELDAHLTLLREVARAAYDDEQLRAEFERHAPRLRRDLERLEEVLVECPAQPAASWRADRQLFCLELARALRADLDRHQPIQAAGGG